MNRRQFVNICVGAGMLIPALGLVALLPDRYRRRLRHKLLEMKRGLVPGRETNGGWTKYQHNPVLGGELGTCFDASALKDKDRFRLWFSWRPKQSIALVESHDGINWSEPTIVLGPEIASGWEKEVNRPIVIQSPEGYRMWYTGQTLSGSWIGAATSIDGVQWERHGNKPVLSPSQAWEKQAVMCPHVLWNEELRLYQMWYSGGEQGEPDAIGYAVSTDGYQWEKHTSNPVFVVSSDHGWEQFKVTACQVVRREDGYWMFYIGFVDDYIAQIGLARSRDGISGWQRHPANPLIGPANDRNAWDYDATYKPTAVLDGGRWLLWYNGRQESKEQIGLAIHEGKDLWAGIAWPAIP